MFVGCTHPDPSPQILQQAPLKNVGIPRPNPNAMITSNKVSIDLVTLPNIQSVSKLLRLLQSVLDSSVCVFIFLVWTLVKDQSLHLIGSLWAPFIQNSLSALA